MNPRAMLVQGLAVLIGLPLMAVALDALPLGGADVSAVLFGLGYVLGGTMVVAAVLVGVVRLVSPRPAP